MRTVNFRDPSSFNANAGISVLDFLNFSSNATGTISGGDFGSIGFLVSLDPDVSLEILGTDFAFTPSAGGGMIALPGTGSTPITEGLLTGTLLDGNDFSFILSGDGVTGGNFGGLTLSSPIVAPEPGSAMLLACFAFGVSLKRRHL